MDSQGGRIFLRRPEGGREWEAAPDDVRPVPAPELPRVGQYVGGLGRHA
jgi:hypothetical protein